jgi:hypothetical protein
LENINGQIIPDMLEIGLTIHLMVREPSFGMMAEFILVSGKII